MVYDPRLVRHAHLLADALRDRLTGWLRLRGLPPDTRVSPYIDRERVRLLVNLDQDQAAALIHLLTAAARGEPEQG